MDNDAGNQRTVVGLLRLVDEFHRRVVLRTGYNLLVKAVLAE